MRNSSRLIIVSLTAAALVTLALAADGFSVKRIAKAGDTAKWHLKANFEVQGQEVVVTGTQEEKVTDVAADGTITLESTQSDQHLTFGGQDVPSPTSPAPEVSRMKPDGEVLEFKGDAATPAAYRLSTLQLLIDPGKPLNIGDTWSFSVKTDDKLGLVAATANYKLLGEEKIGDYDTLKISSDIKETEGTDPASSVGTIWIDKTNGQMVKADVKWTNAPLPGSPVPLTGSVVIERI